MTRHLRRSTGSWFLTEGLAPIVSAPLSLLRMQPPPPASSQNVSVPPPPVPAKGGLRSIALKASAYELVGFATTQILRLISNLVLTRLLFPEAFGLSSIVAVYCQGLTMLSDVGIGASVIRSPEGDDENFLNTAWTISVVRGAGLYLIALVLAWPAAALFGEEQLGPLLAVGSAGILISGFNSTTLLTLRRRVQSRTLILLELVTQVLGLVAIVVTAYITRSVWALIVGTHVSTIFRTLVTHFYFNLGYRNRFHWSKEAADSILKFGKWIFLSSAFQFLAQQADRIFLGRMAGMAELGVYTVAATLSELGGQLVVRLTHQILYPILSRVHREDPQRLTDTYYKARLALDTSIQSMAGVGCMLAPQVIELLYDDRYASAGWMLRVLMVRTAIAGIVTPCESCLFALGHSKFGFLKSMLRVSSVVIGLPVASHFWGITGVVWVTALADLPSLVALLYFFHQKGLFRFTRELVGPLAFAGGALVAWPISLLWNSL